MNKYDIAGKIAMVTGARQGIGKGVALRLAQDGAKVIVTDINLEDCESVVKEIKNLGQEGFAIKLDVTDEQDIKRAIETVKEKYGRLDILVNNAGINIKHELDGMETSDIDKILAVNVRGAILCTKHATPIMKAQGYGKIINMASIASFEGYDIGFSIYTTTKGAILSLTRQQAIELGPYNINVNAVAPGVIVTPLTKGTLSDEKKKAARLSRTPLGRIGLPSDIANAVAFLASDESAYITGAAIVVDGGFLAT